MSGRERELRREDLLDDPIRQFVAWYEEARAELEAIGRRTSIVSMKTGAARPGSSGGSTVQP